MVVVDTVLGRDQDRFPAVASVTYLPRASVSSTAFSSLLGYGAALRNRRSCAALHSKKKTKNFIVITITTSRSHNSVKHRG